MYILQMKKKTWADDSLWDGQAEVKKVSTHLQFVHRIVHSIFYIIQCLKYFAHKLSVTSVFLINHWSDEHDQLIMTRKHITHT